MGAANCPETPRQKMIAMMYLVLTALLALNVGQEVLDGYSEVKDGLVRTNKNTEDRNNVTYGMLQSQEELNPGKVEKFNRSAKEVKSLADGVVGKIQGEIQFLADKVTGETGIDPCNLPKDKIGDTNVTGLMLPPNSNRGAELRKVLIEFKKDLKKSLDSISNSGMVLAEIDRAVNTDAGEGLPVERWEDLLFESRPVITSMTFLTKIQSDVRNIESIVIQHLFNQIGAADIKVNKIDAIIKPRSTYIVQGETFSADIFIAAIDTTKKPTVYLNGNVVEGGKYKASTNRNTPVGKKNLSFDVEIVNGDGEKEMRSASVSYEVVSPMATVSATKMNVFYDGVVNPLSISVPGVPEASIIATADNGTLRKVGSGAYQISPKVGKNCVISIAANIDNNRVSIGNYEFRVKRLPDPTAFIAANGGKFTGGAISKSDLVNAGKLQAELKDSDFDAKFSIESFTVNSFDSMGNSQLKKSDGASFSSEQKNLIKQLRQGKSIYITQIKAKGPDGSIRSLPAIEITIR